jgi:uncharacterized protein YneF (UPF0154 family)
MKNKIYNILVLATCLYIGYILGCFVGDRREIRQLAKEKLRLEIQNLKLEIEINKQND